MIHYLKENLLINNDDYLAKKTLYQIWSKDDDETGNKITFLI